MLSETFLTFCSSILKFVKNKVLGEKVNNYNNKVGGSIGEMLASIDLGQKFTPILRLVN